MGKNSVVCEFNVVKDDHDFALVLMGRKSESEVKMKCEIKFLCDSELIMEIIVFDTNEYKLLEYVDNIFPYETADTYDGVVRRAVEILNDLDKSVAGSIETLLKKANNMLQK